MATSKRVLLDHCVPRPLRRELLAHSVRTVVEQGWDEFDDDELLAHAARAFDVLVTTDQNIRHQQNLARFPIAVIVLIAKTNRLESLLPLVTNLLDTLDIIQPGDFYEIED